MLEFFEHFTFQTSPGTGVSVRTVPQMGHGLCAHSQKVTNYMQYEA